jgi:ribose transport system permease protein
MEKHQSISYADSIAREPNPLKPKWVRKGSGFLIALAVPALFLLIAYIFASVSHNALFPNQSLIMSNVVFQSILMFVMVLGLAINLRSGRIDFSLGSISALASILAYFTTPAGKTGVLLMIPMSVLYGLILGLLSGLAYVLIKLPPLVVSLGVCMICESITVVITQGNGYILIKKYSSFLTVIQTNPWVYLIPFFLVILFSLFFSGSSRFNLAKNALKSDQAVSVNAGINEKRNALGCYMISGALMGLYGVFYVFLAGSLRSESNLSSVTRVFNFLPLILGDICGAFSTDLFGLALGSVATTLLTYGFGRSTFSVTAQSVTPPLLMFFLLILLMDGRSFLAWAKKLNWRAKEKKIKAIRADLETSLPNSFCSTL